MDMIVEVDVDGMRRIWIFFIFNLGNLKWFYILIFIFNNVVFLGFKN